MHNKNGRSVWAFNFLTQGNLNAAFVVFLGRNKSYNPIFLQATVTMKAHSYWTTVSAVRHFHQKMEVCATTCPKPHHFFLVCSAYWQLFQNSISRPPGSTTVMWSPDAKPSPQSTHSIQHINETTRQSIELDLNNSKLSFTLEGRKRSNRVATPLQAARGSQLTIGFQSQS